MVRAVNISGVLLANTILSDEIQDKRCNNILNGRQSAF